MACKHRKIGNFKIIHNTEGRLRVQSDKLFSNPGKRICHRFIEDIFGDPGIQTIEINPFLSNCLIHYSDRKTNAKAILDRTFKNGKNVKTDGAFTFSSLYRKHCPANNKVRFVRYDKIIHNWEVVHELPGRVRMKNPFILRKKEYCLEIERALHGTVGAEKFSTNPTTGSILVVYDKSTLNKEKLINIIESSLSDFLQHNKKKLALRAKNRLNLSNVSLVASGLATFFFPAALPAIALLVLYTAFPSIKTAISSIGKGKIKVEILDATIVLSCLVVNEIAAASLMVWILDVGDEMLERTADKSRKLLSKVLGEKPRFAWLVDGQQEIEVPVEKLRIGDTVVVSAGEQVPVDGEVLHGDAMVDQHILTGESAPVEKGAGDKVFASTVAIAGRIHVKVLEVGKSTTASKIENIINHSSSFKPKVQSIGERIANNMVLPTLGLGGLGYLTGGIGAAMAVINCDYGTGIRVAAPTAVMASLANAVRHGIVIKRGGALEILPKIDTFVFDKTGTLTHETPEVCKILCTNGRFTEMDILSYAAAAEQRFEHPVAKAILGRADELNVTLPKRDESRYHVGFGVEVGINGYLVKVGSRRFMEREKISVPETFNKEISEVQRQGGSAVLVAINEKLTGAIELRSSDRPEAYGIIQYLNEMDINSVLISGDHEEPTRNLAEKLGIKSYYSQVLPPDKANYVKMFQKEGRKVAMVGDGINDSIALSLADISISMRGASSIAVDSSDVIFMDGNLAKLPHLFEISHNLRTNINRSFSLIVYPNTLCIMGALFGVFGLGASLLFNNVCIFLATLNGMLPMHKAIEPEVNYAGKNPGTTN